MKAARFMELVTFFDLKQNVPINSMNSTGGL